MIEKLDLEKRHSFGTLDWLKHWNEPSGAKLIEIKINELVDAVNKQQIQLNNHECRLLDLHSRTTTLDDPTYHEEPAENVQDRMIGCNTLDIPESYKNDPYAEQRKWIGCLVEYGNADDGFKYGILTNIEPRYSAFPFEIDNGRNATADCWLPSKTIFYKGE